MTRARALGAIARLRARAMGSRGTLRDAMTCALERSRARTWTTAGRDGGRVRGGDGDVRDENAMGGFGWGGERCGERDTRDDARGATTGEGRRSATTRRDRARARGREAREMCIRGRSIARETDGKARARWRR